MSNAVYGIEKNGDFKITFINENGEPKKLGKDMLTFCKNHSKKRISQMFVGLALVESKDYPNDNIVRYVDKFLDKPYEGEVPTWKEILELFQGNFELVYSYMKKNCFNCYMLDPTDFISENSGSIDYAYVINVDTGYLEFYSNHGIGVPFGHEYDVLSYRIGQFPIDELYNNRLKVDTCVSIMNDILLPTALVVQK